MIILLVLVIGGCTNLGSKYIVVDNFEVDPIWNNQSQEFSNKSADELISGDKNFTGIIRLLNITIEQVNMSVNNSITLQDGTGDTNISINANGNSYFNSGNIGIGTASPQQKLNVVGNANITGAVRTGHLTVSTTGLTINAINSVDTRTLLAFQHNSNTMSYIGTALATSDLIGGLTANGTGIRTVNKMFAISTNGGTSSAFTITNVSYVGIGTASPEYKLEVKGGSVSVLGSANGNSNSNAVTYFSYNNGTQVGFTGDGASSNSDIFLGAYLGNIQLYAGGLTRLFINGTTGNVGIGVTTPAQKLDILGVLRLNNTNVMDLSMGSAGTFDRLDFKAVRNNLGSAFQLMPNGNSQLSKIAITNSNSSSVFGSGYIGVENTTMRIAPQGVGTGSLNVTQLIIGGSGSPLLGGVNFDMITLNTTIKTNLTGTGNDYVCVNSAGELYRNDIACA
jgi:hypothetical protein